MKLLLAALVAASCVAGVMVHGLLRVTATHPTPATHIPRLYFAPAVIHFVS